MYRLIIALIILCMTTIASAAAEPTVGTDNANEATKQSVKNNIKTAISQIPTKKIMFNVMPATREARHWLGILDKKQFDEAWEKASVLVQKSITKEAFINHARRSREPLGSFIKREIIMAQPHTQLPGSPKGRYVLITFKSQFHNKQKVTETIMLQQETDESWRVAGYFIL